MVAKKKVSPTKNSPSTKRTIKSPKASSPRMAKKSTKVSGKSKKKTAKR